MKWFKDNLLIISIVCLAALLRLILINNVPLSSTNDQIHYHVQASSFLQTGKDLSGTITPLDILLFKYPPLESPQAELPYFLDMLSFSVFGSTQFSAVLPNILFSIGIVFISYVLGKKLFSKNTGLVIGFITAINPWSIFIGRTAYEVVPATFLFLFALYIFLTAKKWRILYSIPILYLAFYSYIGTKLIFVPFVIICIAYAYFFVNKRKYLTQYLTVFFTSLIVVLGLFYQLQKQPANSRLNEIFLPTNPSIEKQVNYFRKQSLLSPINSITTNKITLYGKILAINTFNTLSPSYLFLTGDYFFSQGNHGLFYLLDAIFLVIGCIALYIRSKKTLVLLLPLSCIALLPQILHDAEGSGNFTPHIILLLSIFVFIIGLGITFALEEVKPKYRKLLGIGIVALYAISVLNFLTVYFIQAPKQASIFSFTERVGARYIALASSKNDVIIYASDPAVSYRNYIFYSSAYTKETAQIINRNLTERKKYELPHITFTSCTGYPETPNATIVEEGKCYLKNHGKAVTIDELSGLTTQYSIYNDQLCKGIKLNEYSAWSTVSDLNAESLSIEKFCRRLLTYK